MMYTLIKKTNTGQTIIEIELLGDAIDEARAAALHAETTRVALLNESLEIIFNRVGKSQPN